MTSGEKVTTVAALYVDPRGCYAGLEGVEVWDEQRDARTYDGPWPVVAHPPCSRWCRLAGLVEARWGHKRGEDDGCFEAALASVRKWGGVLEHPAYSDAWAAFGLNRPPSSGAWVSAGFCGGWTCHVEQGRYGHVAKKATWLYSFGAELSSLAWGSDAESASQALVSWCGNHTSRFDTRPRVGKAAAAATPEAFRDELLKMARSVAPRCKYGECQRPANGLNGACLKHSPRRWRSHTPIEFRDILLGMARSAR